MNREELIERIKAVRDDGYLSATYLGNEHVGDLMGDILAVFEQAHSPTQPQFVTDDGLRTWVAAPTDDEWEALLRAIVPSRRRRIAAASRAVDRILAAGFRRTEQGEPPLIECPHWSPGKITMRKGCTACAATQEGENR